MSNSPYHPPSGDEATHNAFATAEEAWFWFVRCQQVRREGARLGGGAVGFTRPCDPDDVYCAVMSLNRRRLLSNAHLNVLGTFGVAGRPPDSRRMEESRSAELWSQALDRLATILRAKGIMA